MAVLPTVPGACDSLGHAYGWEGVVSGSGDVGEGALQPADCVFGFRVLLKSRPDGSEAGPPRRWAGPRVHPAHDAGAGGGGPRRGAPAPGGGRRGPCRRPGGHGDLPRLVLSREMFTTTAPAPWRRRSASRRRWKRPRRPSPPMSGAGRRARCPARRRSASRPSSRAAAWVASARPSPASQRHLPAAGRRTSQMPPTSSTPSPGLSDAAVGRERYPVPGSAEAQRYDGSRLPACRTARVRLANGPVTKGRPRPEVSHGGADTSTRVRPGFSAGPHPSVGRVAEQS